MEQAKNRILQILCETYPSPRPELLYNTPFELLIATMLSAQCTDKQVNKCTRVLFAKYNTPGQFAALSEDELFPYIKSCGFFQTKGRHIIATSKLLLERHNGEVPEDLENLTKLPGVGRKTANVVLYNAFHIPAIAVDTHVFRVANRLGIAVASNVLDTERQLMRAIPKADWGDAHHWLIFHGRRVCHARKPDCAQCGLSAYCAFHQEENPCNL